MNVTVIIPAHNEAEVISKMVRMLLLLYSPKFIKEVIVVDDGSTDETNKIVKILARHDKRIKLITNTGPHGVGNAIRLGLKEVKGNYRKSNNDFILTLDADFIRNLPDLEDFFAEIKDYDGLIGSRYLEKNSLIHYPLAKRICNRAFHLLVRLIYGVKITDLSNNFKFYKKSLYLSLPLSAQNYAINAETGLYPVLMDYKIKELPVTWYARGRDMGKSKFHLLSVAPEYIKVLWKAKYIT